MALKNRIRGLLAKLEVTPGTDPTPDATNNTIQTVGLQVIPYEAETVERGTDRATIGNEKSLVVKRRVRYQFGVHMAGSGGNDTLPKWSPLLEACGFDEPDTDSGEQTVWALAGSGFKTMTMYGYMDGSSGNLSRHPGNYCRGNLALQIATGALPLFQFDFMGLYTTPTDVTAPSFDYTGWQNSVPITKDNTPTASLHGTNIELISLNFSLNNQNEHIDIPNFEGIELVDRPMSGTIVFRAPAISTKDWFTAVDNETTGALQIVHGATAGNILQFDWPAVQLENVEYAESQGFVTISAPFRAVQSSAANDDFKITAR